MGLFGPDSWARDVARRTVIHPATLAWWDIRSRLPLRPAPLSPRSTVTAPPDDPVDVVYTWVDSSDPAWQERHAQATADAGRQLPSANIVELYESRDELRYSLRSLHLYAPWVRRIFVVTDRQVPSWLDLDHPQITVVDHTEIFPDLSVLPTFNSQAIGSCLHRIPGLARRFVYFNDDVFLGQPVETSDFFTEDGRVRVRSSETVPIDVSSDDAPPYLLANHNAVELMRATFGEPPLAHTLDHTPHAIDRDLMLEVEEKFPEVVAGTRASKFRGPDDVPVVVMTLMYALCAGQAVRHRTGRPEFVHVATGAARMGLRLMQVRHHRPPFYCLNASHLREVSRRRQARMLSTFLRLVLPDPSPYERTAV